jgi:uncharacterized protein YuzB (UPF0349 family)
MRCPGCQQENPEGARFCNSCGTRLTAAVPTAVPRTYTPAHLAEKILTFLEKRKPNWQGR